MSNALDQPTIIRLQHSSCRWGLTILMMIGVVLAGLWHDVLPHLMLPFIVSIAYLQGQSLSLPLLKYHRNQWWCFQCSQWLPVVLEPCYIGSWLMSMNVDGKKVIVWPDSCGQQAQWYLRCALLARQRARQEKRAKASFWQRLWQLLLG